MFKDLDKYYCALSSYAKGLEYNRIQYILHYTISLHFQITIIR